MRRYREEAGLTYAELSRRLKEAGHPLAVLALRRIEDGERRVTVDDLTALGVVLGVNPNALLSPAATSSEGVTGSKADEIDVSLWLLGLDILPGMRVIPTGQPSGYSPPLRLGRDTYETLSERCAFWDRAVPESDSTWPYEVMLVAQATYDKLRFDEEPLYLCGADGEPVVSIPAGASAPFWAPQANGGEGAEQMRGILVQAVRRLSDQVQELQGVVERDYRDDDEDKSGQHGVD